MARDSRHGPVSRPPDTRTCRSRPELSLQPDQHHQAAEQAVREQVDHREDHSEMIPTRDATQARSNNRALRAAGAAPFAYSDATGDPAEPQARARIEQALGIPKPYEAHVESRETAEES